MKTWIRKWSNLCSNDVLVGDFNCKIVEGLLLKRPTRKIVSLYIKIALNYKINVIIKTVHRLFSSLPPIHLKNNQIRLLYIAVQIFQNLWIDNLNTYEMLTVEIKL